MQTLSVVIFLLPLILSACSPTARSPLFTGTLQPTIASTFTEVPATSIPALKDTPTSAPKIGDCPTETADLKLFINTDDGYCFLYPKEDAALPPYLVVINPTGMPGDMPGDAWVQTSVDAASSRTAAEVADGQIAEAGEGFNITRSEILMEGKQAVVVDGLPGPDPWRKVFIVDNDRLYMLFFLPWIPNADGFSQLEDLYSSVIDSFHVLPPLP